MKLVKQKKEFKLDFSKYEGQIVGPPLPALPSVLSPATAVLKARADISSPAFPTKTSAHVRTAKGIKAPARYLLKSLDTRLSDWTTRYPEA